MIENKEFFTGLNGVTENDIKEAEKRLDVRFSDEYKMLLTKYGIWSFEGHEFVGISKSKRLNVVDTTEKEKSLNGNALKGLYVLEVTGIDGIVIWQSNEGDIYRTVGKSKPKKLNTSLSEYIKNC